MVTLNEPVPLKEGFLDTIIGVQWGLKPDNCFLLAQEDPDAQDPGLGDAIFYSGGAYAFTNIEKVAFSSDITGASYHKALTRFLLSGSFSYADDDILVQGSTDGVNWVRDLTNAQVPTDGWSGVPHVFVSGIFMFYDSKQKTTFVLFSATRSRPAQQDVEVAQFWKYSGGAWSAASAWLPPDGAVNGDISVLPEVGAEYVKGTVDGKTMWFKITVGNRGSAATIFQAFPPFIVTATKLKVGTSIDGPWQEVTVPVPPEDPVNMHAGLINVCVGNDVVVACSQFGVAVSSDGFAWTRSAIGTWDVPIMGVVFIRDEKSPKGRFIYSVGNRANSRLYTSVDGYDWTPEDNYSSLVGGPMASARLDPKTKRLVK